MKRSSLRERFFNSEWTPLLLGGAAGGIWMLLLNGSVAHADDCLRYVREVKNFVAIPKDLMEDCMRTGSVQAIITATLGGMGGGAVAIAISKALTGVKEPGSTDAPGANGPAVGRDKSSEVPHCGYCGAEMAPGSSICPSCNKAKEVCRNCGKKIWSAERDPLCPSCRMAGVKDERPPEKEMEYCGWCGAELRPGASICPSCNKAKEVCRNCGKRIWSTEANPLCPSCKMDGAKDRPAEKEGERCGWCGAEMRPGASICTSCNKGKEVCRNCGKKIWSAEADPLCPSCKMDGAKDRPAEKEGERCGWCGAEMRPGASICTSCNKAKEACRSCGKKIWSTEADPICPSCSMAATKAASPPGPPSPDTSAPKDTDDTDDGTEASDDDEDLSQSPTMSPVVDPQTSPTAGSTGGSGGTKPGKISGEESGTPRDAITGATSSGDSGKRPSPLSPAAQADLDEIRSRIDQIESARAAFNIAKAMMPQEDAMLAAQKLAQDLGINADDTRKLLEMSDDAWEKQKFWALNANNPNL